MLVAVICRQSGRSNWEACGGGVCGGGVRPAFTTLQSKVVNAGLTPSVTGGGRGRDNMPCGRIAAPLWANRPGGRRRKARLGDLRAG